MRENREIRRAAEAARRSVPAAGAPASVLKGAKAAEPVLVRSPDSEPGFWIVPFLRGTLVCGFARVELSGTVTEVAAFGAGPEDRAGWMEASWFERPPARMLEEIRAAHPDAVLSEPILSYDRSPGRWGWRVEIRRPGTAALAAFIGRGGWHVGPAEARADDARE